VAASFTSLYCAGRGAAPTISIPVSGDLFVVGRLVAPFALTFVHSNSGRGISVICAAKTETLGIGSDSRNDNSR
jgi:hypothetical protein